MPAFSAHAWCDPVCPVVIVPGILASFDKKLMYQDIEDNKWGFVWGGNVYKALINELKNSGFVEGENLFIAHYDWRKPVSENWSKYLKSKIEEAKQKSGQNQVDLIAHSMGGLLSRAYIQNDSYKNDVNKLVMMGTPNYGASDAYVVWEGGLYPQSWNFVYKSYFKSIQKSLGKTRDKANLNPPLSFREFFPAIKDLLPTVPFVKDGGGLVALDEMNDKNDFLINLNNNIDILRSRVGNKTRIYYGLAGKTMEEITVNPVDEQVDGSLERWRDGHPIPYPPVANSDNGDETVLLSSALVSEIDNFQLDGTAHTKLPDDARYTIPWFLNPPMMSYLPQPFRALAQKMFTVSTVRADGDEYVAPDSMLSFTVSPNVTFELTDPDGRILSRTENQFGEDDANFDDDPEDNEDIILVTIRNPKVGKYTLKITGNSADDYYVDSTYVNENGVFDGTNEGTIKEGEEKILEATVSETTGVALRSNDNEEGSDDTTATNDNATENKTSNSSGANTSTEKKGSVLGATTVRLKLSAVILGVKLRIEREIATAALRPRNDARLLLGPLNEMLTRAKLYETALAEKNTKQAGMLLTAMRGDYGDFVNKVDKLIAGGKFNQQTVNVLTALKQRLGNAGLR